MPYISSRPITSQSSHRLSFCIPTNRSNISIHMAPSHLHPPKALSTHHPQPPATWRPTQIPHLKPTLPHRTRPPLRRPRPCTLAATRQIPQQDATIIPPTGQHPPIRRTPLNGIHIRGMPAQLEEGLPRLADVEDADQRGLGGEGREEVGVVGGGGDAEERGGGV
jgi:hypothetical protein